ncbi:MAG: hypothetical protein JSW25_06775 [Thermoplasmata archaeon]|nr:MAG: hypothetical protein JSW25_06775 [Thermoplasmata archaeon]
MGSTASSTTMDLAPVSVLSIDVGALTQDILFWNGSYATSFKLVMPSPTQILAARVRKATSGGRDILLYGETMGGGPVNRAIRDHLGEDLGVAMTERAARTIRDDLERVAAMGVEIVEEDEVEELGLREDVTVLETRDVNGDVIRTVAKAYGLHLEPLVVAVGVEDHGTSDGPQESDRVIRFDMFQRALPTTADGMAYEEPPSRFTRMVAVKRTLGSDFPETHHLVMDSKVAALFGAASVHVDEKVVAVDVGNGHTTGGSLVGGQLTGLFEHHTRMLTQEKAADMVARFQLGELNNEEVFSTGGHGCHVTDPIGRTNIVVTGPRRTDLFVDDPPEVTFVDPHGDTMITGNVGLTEAARSRFDL